jgi:5-methyltetrahydrofolate--homocysteine methyltransferase
MDEEGIPETPEQRLAVAGNIIERAGQLGIRPEDIIIDPLALTMGADSSAGRVALETIELLVKEFGVNVTMGASNISFGLPDRKYINAAFIAMAIHAGLTCPITNPLVKEVNTAVLAADLSMGHDDYGMNWIKAYRMRQGQEAG